MSAAIIVGTDGSETATLAVGKAARLASELGAPLHIVTAFGPRPAAVGEEFDWMDTAGEQADRILAQATSGLDTAGLEIHTHGRPGDAASVLIDIATETDAEVIVVGNKGINGVSRFLLGNVPNKVVHHAPCDVLVVRTT